MVMKELFASEVFARLNWMKKLRIRSFAAYQNQSQFGNRTAMKSRNCRRILSAPPRTRFHQFKPCNTARVPYLACSFTRNFSMENTVTAGSFWSTFSTCEIAAHGMIFGVSVSAPGRNQMDDPAQGAG